ncbi:SdiA-regulated domain-containing protein [Gimesia aquarii]|uniref:SdiA-regulated n=1 Tax=Gimesia aquarii TaxID=2527964 RepID=A0A517VTG9_9PLAN|nr:SdiA-regulated domain-containing protein [Gimesia aquarii]QDT96259.1 SdiA-regulated [Gimesia aquarii]QDU11268.1 SdiA-regulated [Gimesia aquarii]
MKFILVILCLFIHTPVCKADTPPLVAEIKSISQLHGSYRSKYSHSAPLHLSGITTHSGNLFVVGDKSNDRYLYGIEHKNGHWHIVSRLSLNYENDKRMPSFEGVACKGNTLFVVNEDPTHIYSFSFNSKSTQLDYNNEIKIDFDPTGLSINHWDNSGFEGIAYDNQSRLLYLAKERNPRFILAVSLNHAVTRGIVVSQFDVPGTTFTDDTQRHLGRKKTYSGLTFHNGFLYALERRGYSIIKIDPTKKIIVSRLSFAALKDGKYGSLYKEGTRYGLAEGIVFHNGNILIGIDNNGKDVDRDHNLVKMYNLSGNEPSIVILGKPDEF